MLAHGRTERSVRAIAHQWIPIAAQSNVIVRVTRQGSPPVFVGVPFLQHAASRVAECGQQLAGSRTKAGMAQLAQFFGQFRVKFKNANLQNFKQQFIELKQP